MAEHMTRQWKTVFTAAILAPALAAVIAPLALRAERQAPAAAAGGTFSRGTSAALPRQCEYGPPPRAAGQAAVIRDVEKRMVDLVARPSMHHEREFPFM